MLIKLFQSGYSALCELRFSKNLHKWVTLILSLCWCSMYHICKISYNSKRPYSGGKQWIYCSQIERVYCLTIDGYTAVINNRPMTCISDPLPRLGVGVWVGVKRPIVSSQIEWSYCSGHVRLYMEENNGARSNVMASRC